MERNIVNPPSFFRVTEYEYKYSSTKKVHYPCFKLRKGMTTYHLSLKEAEEQVTVEAKVVDYAMKNDSETLHLGTYAYVITELPLGLEVNNEVLGQSLSERVYGPDGILLGERTYCNFIPSKCCLPEDYNRWGRRCLFRGCRPEEIKFKPGDIVEVFGFSGNDYWSDDEVNLAIVVKCPPAEEEVSTQLQQHLSTHSGHEVCDHHLSLISGHRQDTYEVLSFACEGIDHSPTFATFSPTLKVSPRIKERLQRMLEEYNKGDGNSVT